jgi:hypothetical protein
MKGVELEDPDLLQNRPLYQRAVVISAGVIANILLTFLIATFTASSTGIAHVSLNYSTLFLYFFLISHIISLISLFILRTIYPPTHKSPFSCSLIFLRESWLLLLQFEERPLKSPVNIYLFNYLCIIYINYSLFSKSN